MELVSHTTSINTYSKSLNWMIFGIKGIHVFSTQTELLFIGYHHFRNQVWNDCEHYREKKLHSHFMVNRRWVLVKEEVKSSIFRTKAKQENIRIVNLSLLWDIVYFENILFTLLFARFQHYFFAGRTEYQDEIARNSPRPSWSVLTNFAC